jgi:hypothetical protein
MHTRIGSTAGKKLVLRRRWGDRTAGVSLGEMSGLGRGRWILLHHMHALYRSLYLNKPDCYDEGRRENKKQVENL